MFQSSSRRGFDWWSLILGILLLILSFMVLRNPGQALSLVTLLVAFGTIIRGIYELWFRQGVRTLLGIKSGWLIVMGIIDILVGFIFIFNRNLGVTVIAIVFAIWFLFDSIGDIRVASVFKQFHRGYYWFLIVLYVLQIILAIFMLLVPAISALSIVWLIAFYLMLTGIAKIVQAF